MRGIKSFSELLAHACMRERESVCVSSLGESTYSLVPDFGSGGSHVDTVHVRVWEARVVTGDRNTHCPHATSPVLFMSELLLQHSDNSHFAGYIPRYGSR